VGSGPAGLAAAQQLTRAGHTVAVYERNEKIGGLLRYGIPDFKMEKSHIDRRLAQMEAEGTRFRPGVNIGVDITWEQLKERYDAVVVATGALKPRDLNIPGRDLDGVHFAMEYLTPANKAVSGELDYATIDVRGKNVIILGGGDTGADCIGTAHRQGAASVTTLAIGKKPADSRPESQPWPMVPNVFEIASAHEEGGARVYTVSTVEFLGDENGKLRALRVAETDFVDGKRIPKVGTEREIPADFVFLALGFVGGDANEIAAQSDLSVSESGNFARNADFSTNEPGVFVAGDAGRGASLIVWAIAEGRSVAAAVDTYLDGSTFLPAPVQADAHAFSI
ncbi:MAG: glutamate synthase, partial [Actinomycetota bacterium]